MKIGKGKTKRILLSLLLCGSFASTAHAAEDEYTVTWDDYTGLIKATEATYTYTDAEGNPHTITYETVDMDKIEPGEKSITVASEAGSQINNSSGTTIDSIEDTFAGLSGTNGGAVSNSGTITAISGSTFSKNTASSSGGAIYNSSSSISSIEGNYFIDNTGSNGGAIYNNNRSSIGSIEDSYFVGNTASSNGGAIYNYGSLTGSSSIGSINGSYFINNTANTYGGAIYNYRSSIGSTGAEGSGITGINDSYFVNNTANSGGAIYNYYSSSIGSIEGSYFVNNTANSGSGGAIYNYSSSSISSIEGSYFVNNTANSGSGGAIYNNYSNASIGSIEGSYFIGNNSSSSGGAIYNNSTIERIDGSYFVGNNSSSSGGAIYNTGGVERIEGSYFIGNTGSSGGAIYNNYYTSIEGCYFAGNCAEGTDNAYGGAIYNEGSQTGEITVICFIENHAKATSGGAMGGAIYNTATVSGGISIDDLSGNYAEGVTEAAGGGIYDTSGSTITVTSAITDNHATASSGSAKGGAVYNTNGTLSIGGDISGNYAQGTTGSYGGAIYNTGSLTIAEGVKISGNTVTSTDGVAYGGAIYNSGTVNGGGTLSFGDVTNNTATGATGAYGGAIYDTVSTSVSMGNAAGNSVTTTSGNVTGGVIYLEQAFSGAETAVTVNGSVTGNHAETGNGTASGGAFYNNANSTLTIGGDISGNYASGSGDAFGGAVYNEGILNIEKGVTLSGNYVTSTEGEAAGGAIYNTANGTITGEGTLDLGDVTGNSATGNTGAKGGAIYDEVSTEVNINGNASGNYVKTTSGNVAGGVVYLAKAEEGATAITVTGDVTGNSATTEGGSAMGGAFYNNEYGTLTIGGSEISGNWASAAGEGNAAYGGAIYNEGSLTITAEGVTISGNYVTSEAVEAGGGAIYNEGTLEIEGGAAFIGNYAVSTGGDVAGGAICNVDSGTITIGEDVTFSGNYVVSEEGRAGGGAIYNNACTINDGDGLTLGSLTGNYAEGATGAYGGAVYSTVDANVTINGDVSDNYARVTKEGNVTGGVIYLYLDEGTETTVTVNGNVTGNHAETASGSAKGGAFYNNEQGTLTINGSITGNYASGDTAEGGAIYNAGTVNINIENQDAVISGNKTVSGGTEEANVLYGEEGSVTNFSLTDASLTLEDSVTGETGFEVNVTGNGVDATTFYMLNDILDSNLSFDSTTINTINNEVKAYSVNKLSINGNVNFVADVDMANETMDRFTASEYGEHTGKLNVSGMNLISDTEADRVDIYFAEEGLKDSVTSSVGTLPDSKNQQKAYTPLYQYNVAYDNRSDGGYFTFDKAGNNPSADVPEEGEAGAISFMNLMYRYAFEHSDYYMKLPKKVRLAIMKGEEGDVEKEFKNYNGHNLTDPGIWVKPFASNETVPFSHQFTARTKNYGLLVGVDTAFKEKGKWANVFTGYAGYDGIKQTFDGNSTEQYGGVIGVTDTLYKGNFYAALTLSGGENVLKAKTMYGREKTHLYMAGAAVKTGYNLEFAGGNYSFLPTFMASYTYADIKDYTSASGLRMDSDGMHAVELNPNFKFIRNLNNGWMPYVTVGEIWTVGQHSKVKASGTELDELTFRPYTEYGLGVQKMWSKGYDGYAEFLGHAGGRRGFLVNLGFRWTFN